MFLHGRRRHDPRHLGVQPADNVLGRRRRGEQYVPRDRFEIRCVSATMAMSRFTSGGDVSCAKATLMSMQSIPTGIAHDCRLGAEGIVSKRVDGTYRSGPCRVWIKVRNPASIAV
jgi:hypothetical protein